MVNTCMDQVTSKACLGRNAISFVKAGSGSETTRKMVSLRGKLIPVFLEFSTNNNREEGRQNNRPIYLPKVITFSTAYNPLYYTQ